MKTLSSIKIGAKFFVKKYSLDNFVKHELIALGIIPSTPLEIIQKNFSYIIIKCRGAKFALAESTAKQIIGYEA